jgi:uncharacterized membrane protein YvbJ
MRCPRCGTQNPEGKIVCRKCGARLRTSRVASSPVTQETEAELAWRLRYDLTRVGITFAAAAAVAVLLGLFVIR